MDVVYALADQGTIRIDDYHLNTGDKAFFEGHYYNEKSIGPLLTALPGVPPKRVDPLQRMRMAPLL